MQLDYLSRMNVPGFKAAFIERVYGVEVDTDREATVRRLQPFHQQQVEEMGFSWDHLWRSEQVHGAEVGIVDSENAILVEGVDGLICNLKGVALGIYVADCGAIYLLDRKNGAIGLLHSGKKGTELGILEAALTKMQLAYGTEPKDVIGVLAPCIRPPAYDIDFAAQIRADAERLGIGKFHDCGICTSSDLERYYSYRIEKGATGRMLAIFGMEA